MPLTDTAIRGVKPTDKPQKLFDGNGLFLFVTPSGICVVISSGASFAKDTR